MFHKLVTAFKHPGCGGVIYSYERPSGTRYRCSVCYRWGDDLVELASGPVEQPSPMIPGESPLNMVELRKLKKPGQLEKVAGELEQ